MNSIAAFTIVDDDFLESFQPMASVVRQFPSMELEDIKGNKVDVRRLAQEYRLILITMKSTTCIVCPQLLHILNTYGLDPDCNVYQDPFTFEDLPIDEPTKKFFSLILQKDAYFLVLCPGQDEELAQIQAKTNFSYPFIIGHQALALGKALKMNMSDDELWPATLEVTKDSLDVAPIHIGRSPGHYYHEYLLKLLVRERGKCEMKGVIAMREAYDTLDQLKRKSTKCEQKSLATWILTISSTKINIPQPTTPPPPPPPSDSATTAASSDNTSYQLPPEIWEQILSSIQDTASLVSVTRVSRLYFITVCNILANRLRIKMERLRLALPWGEDGNYLLDETDVFSKFVNRWGESDQGVGYRDLEHRVRDLVDLLIEIRKWTRCWSPRRKLMSDWSTSGAMPHLRRGLD